MEELDSFKSEILKDFQESSDLTYHKVDDLSTQVHKLHHDRQEQKSHIISLEQYNKLFEIKAHLTKRNSRQIQKFRKKT